VIPAAPLRSALPRYWGTIPPATRSRGSRKPPASRSLWPRAWELRTNLSAYDALDVALAERLDAPLLTADARLARAPGLRCPVEVLEP
jgi:predicted nucleic acid-binding protein